MGNKFVLLLLLIMYTTIGIMVMLAMASLLAKGQILFSIITMFGVHYFAFETAKTLDRLIETFKHKGE